MMKRNQHLYQQEFDDLLGVVPDSTGCEFLDKVRTKDLCYGGGKGKSSTTVQLTPEQREALEAQTDILKSVVLPTYQETIEGAKNVYGNLQPGLTNAISGAQQTFGGLQNLYSDVGQRALGQGQDLTSYGAGLQAGGAGNLNRQAGGLEGAGRGLLGGGVGLQAATAGRLGQQSDTLGGTGLGTLGAGLNALSQVYNPDYTQRQVSAALAPLQQQYLQDVGNAAAQYGAAGQLGSARSALAQQNLASLNAARQGEVAAGIQQQVEQRKADIANQLAGIGQGLLGQAQSGYGQLAGIGSGLGSLGAGLQQAAQSGYGQAGQLGTSLAGTGQAQSSLGQGLTGQAGELAQGQVGLAKTPLDVYNQYASTTFGGPQAAIAGPDFRGTQGSSNKSKGFGLNFS